MRKLISRHPHVLLFGVFQIFFSAPGQTFLIALFLGPIFKEMGISQTVFAALYSSATLAAALLLNPAGRLLDKYYVHTIVKFVTVFMALGCFVLASAHNLVVLFFAFFILRLIGQGVYGLTASTLMIRQFSRNRGKSLGIITLGFPLSEAVYPFIALSLLGEYGWRMSYVILGLSNILLMLPLQLFLLGRSNINHGEFYPGETDVNPQHLRGRPEERKVRPHTDVPLGKALKDFKFYLLLVASCLPPMVVTGLFFHQQTLFESHGWPIVLAASGLMAYAVVKALSSVGIGIVIDRFGALVPFVSLIVLLGAGTLVAALGGEQWAVYVYFILIGIALGLSSPVSNVVWPHFYGVKHIGSIKGFVATFRNGLTALGPLPIAVALDAGIRIQSILFWIAVCIFVLAALPLLIWSLDRRTS